MCKLRHHPSGWRRVSHILGSDFFVSWPFARGQYSLQLSRTLSILVFLGLLAIDMLTLFTGTLSLHETNNISRAIIAALLLFPLVSASSALGAFAIDGISRSFWLSSRKVAQVSLEIAKQWLDLACRISGFVILLLYAATLGLSSWLAPNVLLPTSHYASSQSFLLSYAMVAAILSAALLPEILRFTYIILLFPLGISFQFQLLGSISARAIEGPTYLLTFNLAICCGFTWLGFRSRELDETTTALDKEEREISYERAFQRARHHADSYIHDNILSALTPAINGMVDTGFLQQSANNALYSLSLANNSSSHIAITPAVFFQNIAEKALSRDPCILVTKEESVDSVEFKIPYPVSEAILSATMEALTNSLRHAARADGTPIKRHLRLRFGDDTQITVFVHDNGDIHRHSADVIFRAENHGIRMSIIGRMKDIGGHGSVSFEEAGTTVTISWQLFTEASAAETHAPIEQTVIAKAMQNYSVRGLAAWSAFTSVILLLCETQNYTTIVWPIVALVWQICAAVLLIWTWPEAVMPRWARLTVLLTVGFSNLLVLFPISVSEYPGYAAWSLGNGWLLSFGLLIRHGNAYAWSAMALLGIGTWGWTLASHQTQIIALTLMAGQVVSLMLISLVVAWFKYLTLSITQTQQNLRYLESQKITLRETTRQLEERLSRVAQKAQPILEQLAKARSLSPEIQLSARLLEGELRDEIRAPGLNSRNLLLAVTNARRRGVEVVLLNDRVSAPLSDSALSRVENHAIEILKQTTSGRVVIRLLPPGRRQLATVVAPNVRWTLPGS